MICDKAQLKWRTHILCLDDLLSSGVCKNRIYMTACRCMFNFKAHTCMNRTGRDSWLHILACIHIHTYMLAWRLWHGPASVCRLFTFWMPIDKHKNKRRSCKSRCLESESARACPLTFRNCPCMNTRWEAVRRAGTRASCSRRTAHDHMYVYACMCICMHASCSLHNHVYVCMCACM
jgi:hypothetical protein